MPVGRKPEQLRLACFVALLGVLPQIIDRAAGRSRIEDQPACVRGHVRLGANHVVVKRGREALDPDEHFAGLELLD